MIATLTDVALGWNHGPIGGGIQDFSDFFFPPVPVLAFLLLWNLAFFVALGRARSTASQRELSIYAGLSLFVVGVSLLPLLLLLLFAPLFLFFVLLSWLLFAAGPLALLAGTRSRFRRLRKDAGWET